MTSGKRDPITTGGEELATERVPPASEHVDKLPPSAALALMLDRQENAITAVRAALNQIAAHL
jgi:N-acetylmuramic acid 6-phosphate (MurNAc-6-P) etherase